MKMFRLECSPGVGVYSRGGDHSKPTIALVNECRDIMMQHFGNLSGYRHPDPEKDSLLQMSMGKYSSSDFFYGFSTLAQFRAWFYMDIVLKELGEIGVHLVCYEVNKLYEGNTQSCALKEEKKEENVKWRIPLAQYLKDGISA